VADDNRLVEEKSDLLAKIMYKEFILSAGAWNARNFL